MRILAFSDLHFFRGRNDYLRSSCSWIAEQIKDTKPNFVVFCGDLNHSHNFVEVDTLNFMAESIGVIAGATKTVTGRPLYTLSGNHDTSTKSAKLNVISAIASLSKDIYPILEPDALVADGHKFLFAPHPPTTESVHYYNELNKYCADADFMFSHVELADLRYNPTTDESTKHPFNVPSSIKIIVNGHYHHPEIRNIGGRTVVIVGSPCYASYADMLVDKPRGCLLIDSSKTSSTGFEFNHIENPIGPIFHTIAVTDIPKIFSDPRKGRMMLRIKVKSMEEHEEFKDSIKLLRSQVASLRVIGADSKASIAVYKNENKLSTSMGYVDVFNKFCSIHNIKGEEYDYGMEILKDCKEAV